MPEQPQSLVWLEQAAGTKVDIRETCSIGRAPSNHIVLSDEKVSRRHAIVHAQGENEFWLVDLGSSNGTYLNSRRVTQPIQLRDQDRIEIGQFQLRFHHPQATTAGGRPEVTSDKTIQDIKMCSSWLLVADIESSTQLSRRLSPEELPVVTGRWFSSCERIINECGGSIDKYLGDGFLAFWRAKDQKVDEIARALTELKKIQTAGPLGFRMVLHYGQVFTGGLAKLGGERLYGPEVNFIFRMERLASVLGKRSLLSEPANALVQSHLPTTSEGRHDLPSFGQDILFFSLQ
jgi:adenylate cyclase